MTKLSKEELKILNKIAKDLIGCTYEQLLADDPEEADMIYCYAGDNELI